MTPQEKAEELAESFYSIVFDRDIILAAMIAKKCATLAVDEIWREFDANFRVDSDRPHLSEMAWNKRKDYWNQVKEEIQKL